MFHFSFPQNKAALKFTTFSSGATEEEPRLPYPGIGSCLGKPRPDGEHVLPSTKNEFRWICSTPFIAHFIITEKLLTPQASVSSHYWDSSCPPRFSPQFFCSPPLHYLSLVYPCFFIDICLPFFLFPMQRHARTTKRCQSTEVFCKHLKNSKLPFHFFIHSSSPRI